MPSCRSPYILPRLHRLRICEVGNGDDTVLLPSVVGIRLIFTKERIAMLTLCLLLSDVAILHSIRHPSEGVAKTGLLSTIVDTTELVGSKHRGTADEKVLIRSIPIFLVL